MASAFTEIRRRFCLIRENTVYPFLQTMAARKALCFFLLFILTACLLAYGGAVLRLVILALASVGSTAVLLLARRKRFWYRVLLPVLCGILLGTVQSIVILDLYAGQMEMQAEAGTEIAIQAEVMEVVYTNAYSGRYICRITGNGLPCKISLQSASPSLQVGQILTGNIRLLSWEQTDDGFDEERYYLGKGVIAAAEDLGLQNTGETRVRLTGLFQRWNRYLSDRISAHVRNDGLPLAMLLGNRNGLSDSVQRDFRRLGILHLIAVSGSHFSMLSSMMERFMIRLRIRPGHRLKLLGALTVLYMFLTGMTASVLRAGLMFLLALVCRGLEYKIRYFTALNIACGIILLADPFAALDAGLHLSYLAVCGCLLTIRLESDWPAYRAFLKPKKRMDANGKPLPPVRGWRYTLSPGRIAKQGISMLLLNLVITCLTLPLSWLYFGEMSLASLLVNLVYIPATGALLFLTLLYLLLYPLGILISPLAVVLSAFSALLEAPAALLSSIPHISISLLYPFIPVFMAPLVLSVCILPFLRHKMRGIACSLALLLVMTGSVFAYEFCTADQTLLVYRNDRLKDGFAIRSGGDILLIDISDGSANFTNQLLAEAKQLYATEVEGYLLTHYHNRHVSTLQTLTDNRILRKLYLPEPVTEAEQSVFNSLAGIASAKGVELVLVEDTLEFAHITIQLGEQTYLSRSSHPITGISIYCGGERLVYGSSSFPEGDPVITEWFGDTDIGIFGAHSPVYKKTFALPFAEKPKIFIWNGEASGYYTGAHPAAETDLLDCTRFSFRFPDATARTAGGATEPQ